MVAGPYSSQVYLVDLYRYGQLRDQIDKWVIALYEEPVLACCER
jgi:hypothetical protein